MITSKKYYIVIRYVAADLRLVRIFLWHLIIGQELADENLDRRLQICELRELLNRNEINTQNIRLSGDSSTRSKEIKSSS